METEVSKDSRRQSLIADFTDGYASGWRFAVRDAFRNALGINWAPRIVNTLNADGTAIKTKEYNWVQSNQFNFNRGDVIYDNRAAYELKWSEALKFIKIFVQITETFVNSDDSTEMLKFKLYRIKKDLSGVEDIDIFECKVSEFIAFLQTGALKVKNQDTEIDVFQEFSH